MWVIFGARPIARAESLAPVTGGLFIPVDNLNSLIMNLRNVLEADYC